MAELRPDRVRGPRDDEFWAYCAADSLRLQRCAGCAHVSWPVVERCERCGGADLSWEEMAGTAEVVSWATVEHTQFPGVLDVPWETVVVRLSEGPLFVSNIVGCASADVGLGTLVHVTFIDCEDSTGPFRLPVFQPFEIDPKARCDASARREYANGSA